MVMATTMLVGLPASKVLAAPDIDIEYLLYDLNRPRDVSVEVTWDTADEINSVFLAPAFPDLPIELNEGTDYTIVGDVLTLNNSYLGALSLVEGDTLTFEVFFNDGDLALPLSEPNTMVQLELRVIRSPFICENARTGDPYTLLEDAVDAADDGDTILLIAHIDEDYARPINDKNLTIDMADYNINLNTGYIEVKNGHSLEIKNGGLLSAKYVGVDGTGSTLSIKSSKLRVQFGVQASGGGKAEIGAEIYSDEHGVIAMTGATVTVTGDITALEGKGVWALDGAKATVTGNIVARDATGVEAWDADTEVTVNGSIEAYDGVSAGGGAKVIVKGNITAEETGADAIYDGTEITVTGNIVSKGVGVTAGHGVKVTVTGNIDAGALGVLAVAYENVAELIINGDILSGGIGVFAIVIGGGGTLSVTVNGNITAALVGVDAGGEVVVFVGGNIVVTEELDEDEGGYNCGVFVALGAKVTINGTITAPNYIGFLIPIKLGPIEPDGPPEPKMLTGVEFYYLGINDNTKPTTLTGYLQYDDEGKYDMPASFVWVKVVATTPGTGDSTALRLLLGALMVAALGTASVLVHRKRAQREDQNRQRIFSP